MTRARDLAAFVSNADGDIKFDTDTLFIDSSANRVGIGTTTPDTLMHLSGADTSIVRLENSDTSLVGDQLIGGLEFEKTDPSGAGAGVVGGVRMHSASSNGADAYLALSTASSSANNAERMRIDADGKVGIGLSPAFPLDVSTNSSTTNDAVTTLRLSANTTGTAANNFGAAINFSGEDASGSLRDLSTINGIYTDATNRSSAITFKTRANLGSLTEEVRIDPDGLKFNGDTAAANGLSDYEEGTFTPTMNATGTGTTSYAIQTGSYTKIGNNVTAHAYLSITGFTGSGSMFFSGWPFTQISGFNAISPVMINDFDIQSNSVHVNAYMVNVNDVRLYSTRDNSSWIRELVDTDFDIYITMSYTTT